MVPGFVQFSKTDGRIRDEAKCTLGYLKRVWNIIDCLRQGVLTLRQHLSTSDLGTARRTLPSTVG